MTKYCTWCQCLSLRIPQHLAAANVSVEICDTLYRFVVLSWGSGTLGPKDLGALQKFSGNQRFSFLVLVTLYCSSVSPLSSLDVSPLLPSFCPVLILIIWLLHLELSERWILRLHHSATLPASLLLPLVPLSFMFNYAFFLLAQLTLWKVGKMTQEAKAMAKQLISHTLLVEDPSFVSYHHIMWLPVTPNWGELTFSSVSAGIVLH